jgi:hypothetical protein
VAVKAKRRGGGGGGGGWGGWWRSIWNIYFNVSSSEFQIFFLFNFFGFGGGPVQSQKTNKQSSCNTPSVNRAGVLKNAHLIVFSYQGGLTGKIMFLLKQFLSLFVQKIFEHINTSGDYSSNSKKTSQNH